VSAGVAAAATFSTENLGTYGSVSPFVLLFPGMSSSLRLLDRLELLGLLQELAEESLELGDGHLRLFLSFFDFRFLSRFFSVAFSSCANTSALLTVEAPLVVDRDEAVMSPPNARTPASLGTCTWFSFSTRLPSLFLDLPLKPGTRYCSLLMST
jgi:hypothetical protein